MMLEKKSPLLILSIPFIIMASLISSACSYADNDQNNIRIYTNNNLQGIYFDQHKNLYSLEHPSKDKSSYIYLNKGKDRSIALQDNDIGHQGFGVHYNEDNSISIWTSQKRGPFSALLFKEKNGVVIDKISVQLFSNEFIVHNETMPTLSSDGKFLLARGRKNNGDMVIRVFETKLIYDQIYKKQNVDLSNLYKFEWVTAPESLVSSVGTAQALQAIASNGREVSLLYGNARIHPKTIYTYSLSGKLLSANNNVVDGINDAMKFEEQNFYEPEGLSYLSPLDLKILITYAKGKNKRNIIYDHTR